MKKKVSSNLIFYFKKSIWIGVLLMFFWQAISYGDLPEPLIYLSYDNTWGNQGTAGPNELPTKFTTRSGVTPKFTTEPLSSILGQALDYSDATWNQYGGVYGYGNLTPDNPYDDTAMQDALNNLASFTIMFWYNTLDKGLPPAWTPWFYRAKNEEGPPYGRGLVLHSKEAGTFELCIDGFFSSNPSDAYSDANTWMFMAVTYDSTLNINNVRFYKGLSDTPGDVNAVGVTTLVDAYGEAPNTPELHTRISVFCDSAYETVGAGLFDEFRFFGSKTDGSGALTIEQIQTCHANTLKGVCGDSSHPYPIGDFNRDCVVDLNDLVGIAENWLKNPKSLFAYQVDILDRIFTDREPKRMVYPEPISVPRHGMLPLQFAIWSASNGLCRINVSDITDGYSHSLTDIKIYHALPVHVEANTYECGNSGPGLIPADTKWPWLIRKAPFDIAEALMDINEFQMTEKTWYSVVLDINVPADASPGDYNGLLQVELNTELVQIPFALTVHPTIIPSNPSLQVTHWIKPIPENLTQLTAPDWWSDEHFALLEKAGRTLFAFGDTAIKTPSMDSSYDIDIPLIQTIREVNGSYSFDYTNFDRWFELFRSIGFEYIVGSFVNNSQYGIKALPVDAIDAGTGSTIRIFDSSSDPCDWIDFLAVFWQSLYAHLQVNGWTSHYLQYLSDEHYDVASYQQLVNLLHLHMPGIKNLDANNDTDHPWDFTELLDIHCFMVYKFDEAIGDWRRSQNLPYWIYHACSPYPPRPNRHLDSSLCCSRLYPWIAYMDKADGYLYWAANNYRGADEYASSIGPLPGGSQYPGHPPGDNWMYYRGVDELRPSLRMVNFREGLLDHQLLSMLAVSNSTLAEQINQQIIRDLYDYELTPASYHNARKAILDALEN